MTLMSFSIRTFSARSRRNDLPSIYDITSAALRKDLHALLIEIKNNSVCFIGIHLSHSFFVLYTMTKIVLFANFAKKIYQHHFFLKF